MSQARRERRTGQGRWEENRSGIYGIYGCLESFLVYCREDEGLCPRLRGRRTWILPDGWSRTEDECFLVDLLDMCDFVHYVCPRLQERRELRETTGRLREERERLRQQVATLEAEKEGLRATLKMSEASALARGLSVGVLQQEVAEATAENERLSGLNTQLQQGIVEAQRDANEARVEASSTHEKLRETETAFAEAEKKFISAPDLVPCLQSLADEVKTLQRDVRTTTELMAKIPEGNRRSEKTLQQMKRVLHDVGRYPRRRRREKTADAADDGRGAMRRGRICYSCRCKGHLAQNCPQVRATDMVESSNPTTSDSQQRAGEPNTEASSSSGWTIFSTLRRFTSGID